jgi:hypothetical protein
MAYERRDVVQGLIVRSDRGVQYRSIGYQDYPDFWRCLPSMSRKGNCWALGGFVAQIGLGDSSRESSVVACEHEQLDTKDLKDQELVEL